MLTRAPRLLSLALVLSSSLCGLACGGGADPRDGGEGARDGDTEPGIDAGRRPRSGSCRYQEGSYQCVGGPCSIEGCSAAGEITMSQVEAGSECGYRAIERCGGDRCAPVGSSCPDAGWSVDGAVTADAGSTDAGASDAGVDCSGAAEGAPCDQPGASCGGPCPDQCSFCNVLRCDGTTWRRLEAPPAPCFACGDDERCVTGDEYCARTDSDVSGVPDSYACRATPAECRAEPSCACLESRDTFDECVEPVADQITVRHYGG